MNSTSTVFYTVKNGRKSLVYVELVESDCNEVIFNLGTLASTKRLHDNKNNVVHLCLSSDKQFSLYVKKRKRVPELEILFDSKKELYDFCADKLNILIIQG